MQPAQSVECLEPLGPPVCFCVSCFYNTEHDPYKFLDAMDDDRAVESVVQHMLKKKLVEDDFTSDLGFNEDAKHKDPRMKMELRHKQVHLVNPFSTEYLQWTLPFIVLDLPKVLCRGERVKLSCKMF